MSCRWNWWYSALPTVGAWERGLVCSTLCAGKRLLWPVCSASELWGAERERRGLLANILILDLLWCKTWLWEGKGRQCIYCPQTLFGGSESPWACCLLLSMLPCCEDTTLTPHVDVSPSACVPGGREGSTEDGDRHPSEEHSGELITHHWAGGQLFHIMKACSMSRDAPALASCQDDSCPESWHHIQVISEQVLEFREIKWSLPALPCPPWQRFLEPSVTEEQKLDPAVAWWFHPLQPNGRFGLDAPAAQWEWWKLQLIYYAMMLLSQMVSIWIWSRFASVLV